MSRITDAIDAIDATPPTRSARGAVASTHPLTTRIALETLDAGGSAVDAAVAANAVACVVDPASSGLGGDCVALVYEGGEVHGLEAAGVLSADGQSLRLPAFAAWQAMVERFGRVSLSDALAPAAKLAREGFVVTPGLARRWRENSALDEFAGDAPVVGQRLHRAALATTLDAIVDAGPSYLDSLNAHLLEAASAADSSRASSFELSWKVAEESSYRGHPIWQISTPATRALSAVFAMLDEYPLGDLSQAASAQLQVEAMKLAGPSLSSGDLDAALDLLDSARTQANAQTREVPSDERAGCVSVVDRQGMVCVLMNSLHSPFGIGRSVEGITLSSRVQADHQMMPMLMMRAGLPWLCAGGSGEVSRQALVQLVCALVDHARSPAEAFDQARFAWDSGTALRLEQGADPGLVSELRALGHDVQLSADSLGELNALHIDEGVVLGVCDPRADGVPGIQAELDSTPAPTGLPVINRGSTS